MCHAGGREERPAAERREKEISLDLDLTLVAAYSRFAVRCGMRCSHLLLFIESFLRNEVLRWCFGVRCSVFLEGWDGCQGPMTRSVFSFCSAACHLVRERNE